MSDKRLHDALEKLCPGVTERNRPAWATMPAQPSAPDSNPVPGTSRFPGLSKPDRDFDVPQQPSAPSTEDGAIAAAIEILSNWAAIYVHPEQFVRREDSPQVGIDRAIEGSANIIRKHYPAPPQLSDEESHTVADCREMARHFERDNPMIWLLAIIDRIAPFRKEKQP